MIAKVTKGSSFGGLLAYLYGPGQAEEHQDAHRVGGNLTVRDNPKAMAAELRELADENPRIRQPVFHVSLRLPAHERLTDEQWAQAGQRFLEHMGFHQPEGEEAPWVMVRHDGPQGQHAHLVASRVRFDGSRVDVFRDWRRAHEAVRLIEADHGLSTPEPSPQPLATVSKSERESAKRRGVPPERSHLRQALEWMRDTTNGTRKDFEARAEAAGVLLKANVASTGRMNGYSVSYQGWTDAHGDQIWLPASKVHRSLAWSKMAPALAARRAQHEASTAQPTKPTTLKPGTFLGERPGLPNSHQPPGPSRDFGR